MIRTASSFPRRSISYLTLLCALCFSSGCNSVSGGGSPGAQSSSIAITPASAQIRAGDARLFVANAGTRPAPPGSLNNPRTRTAIGNVHSTNRGVTWSVNGIPGGNTTVGTIDARGLYRAPATLPNPNFVKVSASSITGPSASATAPVTLYNPIPILASVSPKSVSVGRFTLVITGSKFVKGAQVQFAGRALQTTFNSSSRVTASGTADPAQVGNAQVLLTNPAPGSANSSAPVNVEVIAPADPTPPDASQVPSQDPAGIFDGQGNFDANAYVQAAKAYGTPAMINERFGNPWTAYHQSISPPTWKQAPSTQVHQPDEPVRVVLLFSRRSVH